MRPDSHESTDNLPRFRAGTDHVESWFVRANDPLSARAVWLKATVLTTAAGTSLSQAWFSVFDGDRTDGFCLDVPLAAARFDGGAGRLDAEVGPLTLALDADGGASAGELGSPTGRVGWDLRWDRHPGRPGSPMSLLPSPRLVDAPFPKNKLLTPLPVAAFAGTVTWNGETWDLGSWVGMQGHNWGSSHSPEYAWGQCVFAAAADGTPSAVLEAASGRIPLGRGQSPLISMLVVRRGEEEYRFDRILDLWRQRPELDFPRWSLRMRGSSGEAHLEMRSPTTSMVCLAYRNPARATSYCLNSKTASVRLRLAPRNGPGFELRSEHGGALEFLRAAPVPEVPLVPAEAAAG
ncbi:MAG: hypothetical protein ACXVW3_07650 [Nocardioidaceae bacterium]